MDLFFQFQYDELAVADNWAFEVEREEYEAERLKYPASFPHDYDHWKMHEGNPDNYVWYTIELVKKCPCCGQTTHLEPRFHPEYFVSGVEFYLFDYKEIPLPEVNKLYNVDELPKGWQWIRDDFSDAITEARD